MKDQDLRDKDMRDQGMRGQDMRDHLLDTKDNLQDMKMIDRDHLQHIHKFLNKQTHIECHIRRVEHMTDEHILHRHNEDSYLMIMLVHKHKE